MIEAGELLCVQSAIDAWAILSAADNAARPTLLAEAVFGRSRQPVRVGDCSVGVLGLGQKSGLSLTKLQGDCVAEDPVEMIW